MCSRLETLFLLYKIDPNSQPSSIQMMIYAFVMNPGNFCRTDRKNFDVIRRRIPHISDRHGRAMPASVGILNTSGPRLKHRLNYPNDLWLSDDWMWTPVY